ncbi:glycylpeptide N-tetradecanoyltransferase [Plasmodium yoelii 17X]|uniref:Glycylpeptide N-tetradecanoyltransferase n=4 Tax=Plasmodium yoelii TaxID=5861 RepID=A0AAE9WTC3_PLAYO|nr:glycylpeptide N-tetradecanoyltransferase, putative [Plasmodium yoelii]EAA20892.1 N-myristoyltransferase [Plasmodium yoelii yoelii]ETB59514.1 glycylpeptide N-tetradecanoyltransferase [Plasmodium yoelii 17X]WBY58104.1 glycylpeptide N-tetradecanoyltransferase [Plasmodium yoelii yoelii]CDU85152.1 glycylpeptide N-tetradecanoyltransferase, putative [Plasmodium yoelii]VTZ79047.1 glycylpeptide N-tetradecanoyltransferase, putative [Plasmodium yoelii]|eukprot:XP_729327.1 glycylpeptide N-tetradecanoyltransferase, putative [Plasmodium yoelii]
MDGDNQKEVSGRDIYQIIKNARDKIKIDYKFWYTQPVPKINEEFSESINEPFIADNKVENVRKDEYKLPEGYVWYVCDVNDENDRKEVYNLLTDNYVEDDDNIFRFNYSSEFLLWALSSPNYLKEWHIGVKRVDTNKLVGFISAFPTDICINKKVVKMVEVNFLCVHKSLRSKRLAPVLIKEVTRRINLKNIWQAVYTAGVYLPKPISDARYYHRTINVKKLIDVGFSSLNSRLTMSRAIKLYKIDDELNLKNLRLMKKKDVDQVHKLLNNYLSKFNIYVKFTKEEIAHWFMPIQNVIYTYVNEVDGEIKDMISFYSLPSKILANEKYDMIYAAYSFYNVATTTSLKNLMQDAICLAKRNNFDVFNALEVMDNKSVFADLKFGEGDGTLKYYLYNWKCASFDTSMVGIVLL